MISHALFSPANSVSFATSQFLESQQSLNNCLGFSNLPLATNNLEFNQQSNHKDMFPSRTLTLQFLLTSRSTRKIKLRKQESICLDFNSDKCLNLTYLTLKNFVHRFFTVNKRYVNFMWNNFWTFNHFLTPMPPSSTSFHNLSHASHLCLALPFYSLQKKVARIEFIYSIITIGTKSTARVWEVIQKKICLIRMNRPSWESILPFQLAILLPNFYTKGSSMW